MKAHPTPPIGVLSNKTEDESNQASSCSSSFMQSREQSSDEIPWGIQVNKTHDVRGPNNSNSVSSSVKKKNLLANCGNLNTDWINGDSCFSYKWCYIYET